MAEAGVDGALIVQPINYKFDHSFVTRFVETEYILDCVLPSCVQQSTFHKALKSHEIVSWNG